ncbi:MAG: hypothetical protein NWR72_13295 [Bacteroidia bacterium]|nr:hypothetical protein [Bacteroidia bacterium]
MTEELKRYEKSIKKRHRFGFPPKEDARVQTSLEKAILPALAVRVFENLGWPVHFQDGETVIANRVGKVGFATEKIRVTFENGSILVSSESLGNEFWDNGRNSKRVDLFIQGFKEVTSSLDRREERQLLAKAEEERNFFEDYQVPVSLPEQGLHGSPQLWIPIVGLALVSLALGYLLSVLSGNGLYIIGLFEFGVAVALAFSMKSLLKWGNYTDILRLSIVLTGAVLLTYFSHQYFLYLAYLAANGYGTFGFGEYLAMRIKYGLIIKSVNLGSIGLIVSWLFQVGLVWVIATARFVPAVWKYQIERVPEAVVEFALFHLLQEKEVSEVRDELAKMGWTTEQDQSEVIEAVSAIFEAREAAKGE